uniref:Putative presegetalin GRVKA1 n=1 Tax=Gypsophila vaccaria TaxID=39387 RepID=F6LNM7_GYPVA|nr:putative presegetalin GRVKA1 [Gypsophila vaccaria]
MSPILALDRYKPEGRVKAFQAKDAENASAPV